MSAADVTCWHRQLYAVAPPYRVVRCGSAYMICDTNANNIAHTKDGAILMWSLEHAEAVRDYLETL